MRSPASLSLAVIFVLTATGCASYFKRKECEKTNWYQHGHDVAMAGKRLDADDHIKQCQKAEAQIPWTEVDTGFKVGMGKYCTSDNVFAVGKAGKPFTYDMCGGESDKKMRARYQEGLKVFCIPSNAYRFGAAGGVYMDVCPSDSEEAWLAEYRKGRKIYLKAVIEEKEREVTRLSGEVARLEGQRQNLNFQQASLNHTPMRRERVFDAATGTYREIISPADQKHNDMRRQQLSSEISSVNYEIQRVRDKQNDLNNELSKMRTEMAAL